jgi:hypothetical protein
VFIKADQATLAEAIQGYCESHDVSDEYKRYIFSECAEHLMKILLVAKAEQALEFDKIPESSLLRTHIPVAALEELELAEEKATRLIENMDTEPLEAVRVACVFASVQMSDD